MEPTAPGVTPVNLEQQKPEVPPEKTVTPQGKKRLTVAILIGFVLLVAAGVVAYHQIFLNGGVEKKQRIDVTGARSDTAVTINMQGQWKGEDKRENYILETIQEYSNRNPEVKVNLKWNGNFPNGRSGAIQATIDQFKSGTIEWDVMWLEPQNYQQIADALNDPNWAKDFLVDFETVPGFKETQKSFILSDPQFRNHMNGVITGPYIEGFYQPFFYNKELADKIGLEVKDKGMTFDDLLGYFKTVSEYNQKNGTSFAILYDAGDKENTGPGHAQSSWNIFQSLFRSQFANLDDIKDTKPTAAKLAAVKKVLGSLEQLGKYKPMISGWEGFDWFSTRYYVLENKAVFYAAGASWMYSHWSGIDAVKTLKMVPVEMPVYQPVTHYIGGYNPMFAVAKNSPVKEQAIALMMQFATPNTAEKWVRYAKGPSGIKGNISEAGGTSQDVNQFDTFITYITDKYGGNVFDSKTVDYVLGEKYKDLTAKFCEHLGAIMSGDITAVQGYDLIVGDMQAVDTAT